LYNPEKKHLVYMGTLFKSFRNPVYIYKLFVKVNENDEYNLHFYSRGDCENQVLDYQNKTHGSVIRHGYVAHSEIENIYANAHYLINLGVSNSTNISSKIFDYMSVGKPILHFYYHDDDVNIKYLEKYDLAIMIKMDEKLFEENAEKLKHFLQKTYNKKADSAKLDHAFYKN